MLRLPGPGTPASSQTPTLERWRPPSPPNVTLKCCEWTPQQWDSLGVLSPYLKVNYHHHHPPQDGWGWGPAVQASDNRPLSALCDPRDSWAAGERTAPLTPPHSVQEELARAPIRCWREVGFPGRRLPWPRGLMGIVVLGFLRCCCGGRCCPSHSMGVGLPRGLSASQRVIEIELLFSRG